MTPHTLAKRTGNVILGGIFIAACCIDPFPANASEPTPATVEVFWLMPDGGTPENVTYPQSYSPDGAVVPGACYQIDRYSAADAALFTADNTLFEGEDYADVNGPGTGVLSWRFECVPAPEPTATPAPAPTETPAAAIPAPAESPASVADTPRADVVTDQVAAKSAAPELAHTGIDMGTPLGAGFLFLLAGVILFSVRFFGKRESK